MLAGVAIASFVGTAPRDTRLLGLQPPFVMETGTSHGTVGETGEEGVGVKEVVEAGGGDTWMLGLQPPFVVETGTPAQDCGGEGGRGEGGGGGGGERAR